MEDAAATDRGATMSPRRANLSEQVAQSLIELMLDGVYTPGTRLPPEPELAARFGVSRTVIREAMLQLRVMKVVQIRQGDGTYVQAPSVGNFMEGVLPLIALRGPDGVQLVEARLTVEPVVARLCAARVARGERVDMEALERHVRDMYGSLRGDSIHGLAQAESDFRLTLAGESGNAFLAGFIEGVAALLHRQTVEAHGRPGMMEVSFNAHRRLVDALWDGDQVGAETAVRDYLTRVAQVVRNGVRPAP